MSVNGQLWWHVARAGGIVAWALLALAVGWGLLLATKLLGRKPGPAWLLDLHRFLGGLAVVFTAIHVGGLVADSYVHFGPAEVLLPFASEWKSGAVAWGIVATYFLVAVELTSLAMRRMSRRLWRGVHLTSFVAFFTASLHGATAGTDASNPVYRWTSAVLVAATVFLTLVRVLAEKRSPARRAAARPRVVPAEAA